MVSPDGRHGRWQGRQKEDLTSELGANLKAGKIVEERGRGRRCGSPTTREKRRRKVLQRGKDSTNSRRPRPIEKSGRREETKASESGRLATSGRGNKKERKREEVFSALKLGRRHPNRLTIQLERENFSPRHRFKIE